MAGSSESGVGIEDFACAIAGQLHQLPVGGDIGNVEVERNAALEGAFEVAGSSHFQIGFGDEETVGGGSHEFEALAGVGGYFAFRH